MIRLFSHTRLRPLGLFLMLCAPIGVSTAEPVPLPTEVSLAGATFLVELALTREEQRRGLMYRTHLPADRGMLFVYDTPQPVRFWNKNVPIPLDILYFGPDRRLLDLDRNVPPCLAADCPLYRTRAYVRFVLELPGGTAARLGIEPGALLQLR